MKRNTTIFILVLCLKISFSQNTVLDSLKKAFANATHDTTRCTILSLLAETADDTEWPAYNKRLLSLCESKLRLTKTNTKEYKVFRKNYARALNNAGYYEQDQGNIKKAIEFYNKSIEVFEEIKETGGLASALVNIGTIYKDQGDISKALVCMVRALKIYEERKDEFNEASALNHVGMIYEDLGDNEKALEYYSRNLKKQEENDDQKGIAYTLNNISTIYYKQGEFEKCINYLEKSFSICEKLNDKYGMTQCLNNMGNFYGRQNQLEKALTYYNRGLKIVEETQHKPSLATTLENIGEIYLTQKKYKEALVYCSKSLQVSQELGFPDKIGKAASNLKLINAALGNYKGALENYELYIAMRDSINNIETQKASIKQQADYDYRQQKAIADAEHTATLKQQEEKASAAKNKQYIIIAAVSLVLLIVAVFSVFLYNRYKLTQKQKEIIESQKEIVEEKQKEILDSINYAKRIQNAILPPPRQIAEHLKESFILYKPKDIVAGDFYWLEKKDGKILFAAADCTGHGVPGAMVSVICNNGLNRSVREYGITNPGLILDKAREIVVHEFMQSDDEVKDGMDISLCCIESNKLEWAGANNPLWILRNGELIEIKADKQPIGKYADAKPFTTHVVELKPKDSIYIFTDGFQDQFGGEKGKKFKTQKLKELLLSIQDKSMPDQKKIIDDTFESWKGKLDQVDDVCVIGVKI